MSSGEYEIIVYAHSLICNFECSSLNIDINFKIIMHFVNWADTSLNHTIIKVNNEDWKVPLI